MISIHGWCPGQRPRHFLKPEILRTPAAKLYSECEVLWVDLEESTDEEEQLVYKQFLPIHPLTLEDITRLKREPGEAPHFPKVEEFPDYLFVVINPLSSRTLEWIRKPKSKVPEEQRNATQLSAVLTEHVLVTHHSEPMACTDNLRNFVLKHAELAERGPDYLFHLILDGIVDQYALVLDHFDTSLEAIEQKVLNRDTEWQLVHLLDLKHNIIQLRKTLIQEREVLARLSRGEFKLIAAREMVYYRNVYDHLVRYTELIEASREMAADIVQLHLSASAHRLNEVMKVLTMISTIILPMTLISGIYGMNFVNLPEKDWRWGYPFALGLMGLTAAVSLGFFKWRKWI